MIFVNKHNFKASLLQKKPGDSVGSKTISYPDFKICIVLDGEAVWEIEDCSYHIKRGDIVFLNIGQKRYFTAFGKSGLRLCSFVVKRDAFSDLKHFLFFLVEQKNLIC